MNISMFLPDHLKLPAYAKDTNVVAMNMYLHSAKICLHQAAILKAEKHGLADLRPLHEDLFPLVEYAAPHLCADRLDYSLRDSVAFEKLSLEDARRVFASLRAHPDCRSEERKLVLGDKSMLSVHSMPSLAHGGPSSASSSSLMLISVEIE